MYLDLKIKVRDWGTAFISGSEQRRHFITAFDGQVPDGRLIGRLVDHSIRQETVRASPDHPKAMAYGSAPPISFRSTHGGIHMVAFGEEACAVLQAFTAVIKKLMTAQFGRLDASSLSSGELVVRRSEQLVAFDCGAIAVKKLDREGVHKLGSMYELADLDTEIRRSVAGGIVSRCFALREEAPHLQAALSHNIEPEVVILGGDVFIDRPGGEKAPLCACIHKLRFALPYMMLGPWEAGHYRSYGYGAFIRSTPAARSDARALEVAA